MEIKSLSFSQLNMFRECPYKYLHSYAHRPGRLPRFVAENALEGSLVHKVLEDWMPDQARDWRKLLKQAYATAINTYENKREFEELTHEQFQGARELLEKFTAREDVKRVKPIAFETPFDLTLGNGVAINGRIDRVDEDQDGVINLVDYKTTRAFIWKSEVEASLQGSMYVLAGINKLYPGRKFRFTIDALRFSPITVTFSGAFLDATLDYLEVIWGNICKLDDANAVQKPNKNCGSCPLRDECDAVKKTMHTIYGEPLEADLSAYARNVLTLTKTEKDISKLRRSYEQRLDAAMVDRSRRHMDFGHAFVFYKEGKNGSSLKVVEKSGGFLNDDNE